MTSSASTKLTTAHKLLTKSTKFGGAPVLVCSNTQCAKPLEKRRYCSKCNFACYCDQECQAKDWEFHKHVCSEDLCQQFEEIIRDFETLMEHFVMMDHNLLPMPGDSRDVL
jgi:sulfatase maturation enzyme AslB (radical SAM superfamily)